MDDLERRIRAANPSPVRRAAAISGRGEAELQALLGTTPGEAGRPVALLPQPPRHPARRRWIAAMAAVLVLATVFVAGNLVNRPNASMAAPPLLSAVPIDETTAEILGKLSAAAEDIGAATPGSERSIAYEEWSANISVDSDSKMDMFVQPQEAKRTWSDDLSGRIVARAGTVKWGEATASNRAAKPGTVLVDEDFGPGQYPAIFTTAPPTTAPELRSYLAAPLGLNEQSTAGDWFKAVQDLRADWPLDGAQNAALLDLVAALPDVSVAGTVTDRLGRTGVAVETDSRAGGTFRDILIFDSKTGFLISAEDVYRGGLDDVTLPAMTVLNYTAWKEAE